MRTTLTLEPDVAEKAKHAMQATGLTFKDLVNEALRCGIDQVSATKPAQPYHTQARRLGLRQDLSYDSSADLLAQIEMESYR